MQVIPQDDFLVFTGKEIRLEVFGIVLNFGRLEDCLKSTVERDIGWKVFPVPVQGKYSKRLCGLRCGRFRRERQDNKKAGCYRKTSDELPCCCRALHRSLTTVVAVRDRRCTK